MAQTLGDYVFNESFRKYNLSLFVSNASIQMLLNVLIFTLSTNPNEGRTNLTKIHDVAYLKDMESFLQISRRDNQVTLFILWEPNTITNLIQIKGSKIIYILEDIESKRVGRLFLSGSP